MYMKDLNRNLNILMKLYEELALMLIWSSLV
jgi:hypothetical protein